jgi:hypothetical protein
MHSSLFFDICNLTRLSHFRSPRDFLDVHHWAGAFSAKARRVSEKVPLMGEYGEDCGQ